MKVDFYYDAKTGEMKPASGDSLFGPDFMKDFDKHFREDWIKAPNNITKKTTYSYHEKTELVQWGEVGFMEAVNQILADTVTILERL